MLRNYFSFNLDIYREFLFSYVTDMFEFLNLGHCDLPFDFAQGGEHVEP